jgi:NAD(P)-dependent dehydrogenase (short-subunit alcohol dehydrogenase family)
VDLTSLFGLTDRAVLITGGSRGIGEMLAHGFVAAGARVYVASRKAADVQRVAEELTAAGGSCVALPGDLSTPAGVDALAAAVAEREPALHVLVNNAGATWGAPLGEYPADGFDKVLDLNVRWRPGPPPRIRHGSSTSARSTASGSRRSSPTPTPRRRRPSTS